MRERVNSAIRDLNYRPLASARGLRGKTFTLGVLVSDIENPFFSIILSGVVGELEATKYELLIGPGGTSIEAQQSMVDAMIDRQMDGLVLIAPLLSGDRLEQVGAQLPVVVVGRHGPSSAYDTVAADDRLGSKLIVDHLVQLGHRRIAHLTIAHERGADRRLPETARANGYAEAMQSHGLEDHIDIIAGTWSLEGGRAAAEIVLESPRPPTAIHAGADVAAFGLLSRLWDASVSIPGTVSVVGYDNSPTAAFAPIGLTSVDQSGAAMGSAAARLLLERLAGRTQAISRLFEPTLVVRSTSGQPPV